MSDNTFYFGEILQSFGFDLTDPNLIETPQRMTRVLEELLYGHSAEASIELDCLVKKTFPATLDELIIIRNITAVGVCPHHFLPVSYTMNIGYIPNTEKCIGLSKLPRIAKLLARRAVLQETLCSDLAKFLMDNLNPLGVAVHLVGVHSCMTLRGVKETHGDMVTTALLGCMRNPESKQEFLQMIH